MRGVPPTRGTGQGRWAGAGVSGGEPRCPPPKCRCLSGEAKRGGGGVAAALAGVPCRRAPFPSAPTRVCALPWAACPPPTPPPLGRSPRGKIICATYFPCSAVCVRVSALRPGRAFPAGRDGGHGVGAVLHPQGQRVRGGDARRDPLQQRGGHRGRRERHQVEGWEGMSPPACCIA